MTTTAWQRWYVGGCFFLTMQWPAFVGPWKVRHPEYYCLVRNRFNYCVGDATESRIRLLRRGVDLHAPSAVLSTGPTGSAGRLLRTRLRPVVGVVGEHGTVPRTWGTTELDLGASGVERDVVLGGLEADFDAPVRALAARGVVFEALAPDEEPSLAFFDPPRVFCAHHNSWIRECNSISRICTMVLHWSKEVHSVATDTHYSGSGTNWIAMTQVLWADSHPKKNNAMYALLSIPLAM